MYNEINVASCWQRTTASMFSPHAIKYLLSEVMYIHMTCYSYKYNFSSSNLKRDGAKMHHFSASGEPPSPTTGGEGGVTLVWRFAWPARFEARTNTTAIYLSIYWCIDWLRLANVRIVLSERCIDSSSLNFPGNFPSATTMSRGGWEFERVFLQSRSPTERRVGR